MKGPFKGTKLLKKKNPEPSAVLALDLLIYPQLEASLA